MTETTREADDDRWSDASQLVLALVGEAADGEELITQAVTAISRLLPGLADDQERRVINIVAKVAEFWNSGRPSGAGVDPAALPRTVVELLTATHAMWIGDGVETCVHRPKPADGIGWAFAWRPFAVVCALPECRDAWLRRAPDYCTGCGADVARGSVLWVELGPLRLCSTFCAACGPFVVNPITEGD